MYSIRMARRLIREALTRLTDQGLRIFTVNDLVKEVDLTPDQAQALAHRLQRTHRATRIRRGLYALVPPEDWDRPGILPVHRYLTAAAIVEPAPYFLAFYTAMDIHRMIQHPLRDVFVAVQRQRREILVGQIKFRFVALKQERFFGFEDQPLEGKVVKAADLERTFLDCVDRFDLCGGLEEVVRGFARRHDDLDPDRLLRYIHRFKQPTTAKRLGFLLETVGHGDTELLLDLEKAAGRLKHYVPLDPTAPTEGGRNKRWELLVNTEPERLLRTVKT